MMAGPLDAVAVVVVPRPAMAPLRRPLRARVARHEAMALRADPADVRPQTGADAAAVRDELLAKAEHVVAAGLLRLGVGRLGKRRDGERQERHEPCGKYN